MFKKIILICLILLTCFALKADEFDAFLAKIDEYRNSLRDNYKNVITSQHQLNIEKHFGLAAVDHQSLAIGIHYMARQDLQDISTITQKFEVLKRELSLHPERVNELSIEFFTLLNHAKRKLRFSEDYLKDLQIVQESWNTYCDEERVKELDRFFKPLANFAPNQEVGFLSAPKSPNGIHVSGNFSGDGDLQGFYSHQRPGTSEKENENWQIAAGGAAVAAGAVCAYFTLGVGAQACATYAYFTVMAVKLITDIVRFAGDNEKMAERVNKQSEIRQSIYNIQLDAIKALEAETDGLVKTACEQRFVKGKKWPTAKVKKLVANSEKTYFELKEYLETDLADIEENHYEYLLSEYFPTLVDDFLGSVKMYYVEREKLNKEAQGYLTSTVIKSLEGVRSSQTKTRRVRFQQEVWSDVIKGDAMFLEDEEFSFVQVIDASGHPSFENIWKQVGPEVLKRAVQ